MQVMVNSREVKALLNRVSCQLMLISVVSAVAGPKP